MNEQTDPYGYDESLRDRYKLLQARGNAPRVPLLPSPPRRMSELVSLIPVLLILIPFLLVAGLVLIPALLILIPFLLVVAIAGTLLLIAAGTGRKPVPVPVRTRKR